MSSVTEYRLYSWGVWRTPLQLILIRQRYTYCSKQKSKNTASYAFIKRVLYLNLHKDCRKCDCSQLPRSSCSSDSMSFAWACCYRFTHVQLSSLYTLSTLNVIKYPGPSTLSALQAKKAVRRPGNKATLMLPTFIPTQLL